MRICAWQLVVVQVFLGNGHSICLLTEAELARHAVYLALFCELCLQEDAGLRLLRFQLVPRQVSEEQFWRRYFAAVGAIRREVLGAATAGGSGRCSDALHAEGAESAGVPDRQLLQ